MVDVTYTSAQLQHVIYDYVQRHGDADALGLSYALTGNMDNMDAITRVLDDMVRLGQLDITRLAGNLTGTYSLPGTLPASLRLRMGTVSQLVWKRAPRKARRHA